MALLGFTRQEVADLIGPLNDPSLSGRYREEDFTAPNGKRFKVLVETYRGFQECPWRDRVDWAHSSGATDIIVRLLESQQKTVIPGLLRHLIEAHHFFEGGGYRVAPETIVEMFGTERNPGSIEGAKAIPLP